jgi:hypothetical protein
MNELLLFFLPVCINIRLGDALIEREKADEWNKTHSLSRNKTDGKKKRPLLHIQGYTTTTLFFTTIHCCWLAEWMVGGMNEPNPKQLPPRGPLFFSFSPSLYHTTTIHKNRRERERLLFYFIIILFFSLLYISPLRRELQPKV